MKILLKNVFFVSRIGLCALVTGEHDSKNNEYKKLDGHGAWGSSP
jgi:hypothetical protein